jgi:exonuclease SbcD
MAEIETKIPVLIIAGNHDSADRLNYASSFLEKHDIFVSVLPPQEENEYLKKIVLKDEYGDINFYLLPFMKPGYVRHLYEEGLIKSYESAIRETLAREKIDWSKRNVLLSHQFYVSGSKKPETCESELSYITVGGIDSVDISVVENFDYVALGHIHGPQAVGKNHIRYCGTPLKYSVSEENHEKSISLVSLGEKGEDVSIENIPLTALRDIRTERGLLKDILARATEENKHDYLRLILTDEIEHYKPKDQLEEVYDYILELKIDNQRTQNILEGKIGEEINLEPMAAFREFFQEIQSCPMSEEEEAILTEIIEQIKESE